MNGDFDISKGDDEFESDSFEAMSGDDDDKHEQRPKKKKKKMSKYRRHTSYQIQELES